MRTILLLFYLVQGISVFANNPQIARYRELYALSPDNKDSAQHFLAVMERAEVDADPLVLCYKAMAYMLCAKHALNPYSKLTYFRKGETMMDKAVLFAPQNTEIRFMRFCAQANAPRFLNYRDDIEEDKHIVLKNWHRLADTDLKQRIKEYMLQCSECNKNERSKLYYD